MQATTRRRGAALALTAIALTLGACGKGHNTGVEAPDADDIPACGEVFVDGATVTAKEWANGCIDEAGVLQASVSYTYDCGTASQNDLGWGYEGGTFHAGAEMPGLDVVSTCGGGE